MEKPPQYILDFINNNKNNIKNIYEMNHINKDEIDILNFICSKDNIDIQYIDNKNIHKIIKKDYFDNLVEKLPNKNTIIMIINDNHKIYNIFFNLE